MDASARGEIIQNFGSVEGRSGSCAFSIFIVNFESGFWRQEDENSHLYWRQSSDSYVRGVG